MAIELITADSEFDIKISRTKGIRLAVRHKKEIELWIDGKFQASWAGPHLNEGNYYQIMERILKIGTKEGEKENARKIREALFIGGKI